MRKRISSWHSPHSFPASAPRQAKGGIKAQSKGSFGKNWWTKQWLTSLENFGISNRLTRGRSYARQGQVLSIQMETGKVVAYVQGSRAKPYQSIINIKTLSPKEYQKLVAIISKQAVFSAKLLANEMPPTIEEAFQEANLSLFPSSLNDLTTDCSCADWSNPCKHIAAVYYLLGEELDRDPFLLFKLRGIDREELLYSITHTSSKKPPTLELPLPHSPPPETYAKEALPEDPLLFWEGKPTPHDLFETISLPEKNGALLQRLGPFPFWRSQCSLFDSLQLIMKAASTSSIDDV